jgi:transcriptional/translational regulatory protein YebC/TACO1
LDAVGLIEMAADGRKGFFAAGGADERGEMAARRAADGTEVIGAYEELEALQAGLRDHGLPVVSWEHRWIAQTPCPLQDADVLRACLRMLDALEELDDVRAVTANLEADEAQLQAVLL